MNGPVLQLNGEMSSHALSPGRSTVLKFGFVALGLCLAGCSGSQGASGSGGHASSTGGASASGGSGTGGAPGTGGAIAATGGSPASTGGNANSGGAGGYMGATGSGGAASATGGATTGTGGGGAGGSTSSDTFVLAWQDDFNSLNTSTWRLQNFTYDGNEATFTPQNASVTNGMLNMALTKASSGAKPYLGVEARSSRTITYGKISARMRFAKGSGIVSGLVLFYTPFPNCDWNEIDIEHLGKSPSSSQMNAMVYTGTYNANCASSVSPTQDPLVVPLGFDAEADFHVYDVEWTPSGVKYFADGVLLRTWTKSIALLKRPMNVLLTIWASSAADWAGAIASDSAPTSATIDWIKVYNWKAP